MKISYAITVHNEVDELNKLLDVLIHKTDVEDEIVICDDYSNEETHEVITSWTQQYAHAKVINVHQHKFEGDFSELKNYSKSKCSGDYIFHIDADEYPHEQLLFQIKEILEANDIDLVWIPRVNTVEGLTEEHIRKWGWRVTENGWVNYPDYQARVFRNNEKIKWIKPVHEVITGADTYSHLPPYEEFSLYHPKAIDKQEKQNSLYSTIKR